jgi:site-specific DNA-methyltransferase (adenine-specific)
MFLQKDTKGYYYIAEKSGGKAKYVENVGLDPESWLATKIPELMKTNPAYADELRKIQKRFNPPLKINKDNCQIENADFATLTPNNLRLGLADMIITDPPYPKEYLYLYDILADKAVELVKPGGSVIVMIGQSYLPEIITSLSKRLSYQWIIAYLTPGGQSAQLWTKKVNTFWKPVLWFVNGKYERHWIGDVSKSAVNDNDKRFHEWGQSESGMADLIKRFSKRGDIILDPFMGSGTTGKMALELGRKFIGFDKDKVAYDTTVQRLGYAK